MDPTVAHQRAHDVFAGVFANVSPDRLGAPIPYSEWTIRDPIEHVIYGNEQPCSSGLGPGDQLAAFLGRTVP